MITGDHPVTALEIARQLGLADEGAQVCSGVDIAAMSDEQWRDQAARVGVFARVAPEHKLRIVGALQARLEPTEPGTMQRRPFAPGESVSSRGIGRHVVMVGALLTIVALGVGSWAWRTGHPAWGTMIFVTLTFSRLGHAMAVRSHHVSLWTMGLAGNPVMSWAILVTLGLQLAIVYAPPAQALFGTVPLTAVELAICSGASLLVFLAVELEKWVLRRQLP